MKIRITVTEEVVYTDTVEMTAKEYKDYQKRLDNHHGFPNDLHETLASKIQRNNETWLYANLRGVEIEKET